MAEAAHRGGRGAGQWAGVSQPVIGASRRLVSRQLIDRPRVAEPQFFHLFATLRSHPIRNHQ